MLGDSKIRTERTTPHAVRANMRTCAAANHVFYDVSWRSLLFVQRTVSKSSTSLAHRREPTDRSHRCFFYFLKLPAPPPHTKIKSGAMATTRDSFGALVGDLVDSFPLDVDGRTSISDFGKMLFSEGQRSSTVPAGELATTATTTQPPSIATDQSKKVKSLESSAR